METLFTLLIILFGIGFLILFGIAFSTGYQGTHKEKNKFLDSARWIDGK